MKKIIIILWAMLICSFAYGQESLQERLKSNPVVDSLFAYARKIGIEPVGQYEYDGEYMNTMKFSFGYITYPKKPKTGEEIYSDSVWNANRRQMADSIRQTFMTLSDVSNEVYMKEIHNDRMDTLVYVATFGDNDCSKGDRQLQNTVQYHSPRSRSYHYPQVPEAMVFELHPSTAEMKVEETDPVSLSGYMCYYKIIGGDETLTPKYVDKKSYGKVLNKIFKEKGIKKQHCYVRKDREYQDLGQWYIFGGVRKGYEGSTEMNATTYQFPSREMIRDVYKVFCEETWKYIEQHPDTRCEFCYETKMNSFPLLIFSSEKELKDKQKETFRIYITPSNAGHGYTFIILNTKMSEFGTEFLPMEWENLKSWKNGKKVYYRK